MSLFTLCLLIGVALAGATLLYGAPTGRRGAWADVALGSLVAGVLMGRALHIALHWAYFSTTPHEITRLDAGGLNWHGALIGAMLGAYGVARWRDVVWSDWLRAGFVALPLLSMAGWGACWAGLCAYGAPIPLDVTPAPFLVHDAMDVYGIMDLRYATQPIGVGLSGVLLLCALLMALKGWGRMWRWGAMLAGVALISLGVGFLRGDAMPLWTLAGVSLRLDQWLDVILMSLGISMAGVHLWRNIRYRFNK